MNHDQADALGELALQYDAVGVTNGDLADSLIVACFAHTDDGAVEVDRFRIGPTGLVLGILSDDPVREIPIVYPAAA